jgi:hypothetical protein
LHNIKVTSYLLAKPEFCDWTATVTFYTALHIVEAVFFHDRTHTNQRHGQSHENREKILKGTKSYQNIHRHYRPLQSVSVVARYLRGLSKEGLTFQQYMPPKQVQEKLIKHHLTQVIKTASKFLSSTSANLIAKEFNKTLK